MATLGAVCVPGQPIILFLVLGRPPWATQWWGAPCRASPLLMTDNTVRSASPRWFDLCPATPCWEP